MNEGKLGMGESKKQQATQKLLLSSEPCHSARLLLSLVLGAGHSLPGSFALIRLPSVALGAFPDILNVVSCVVS
jgi:hypothetical protein